jgi:hypothetical protein
MAGGIKKNTIKPVGGIIKGMVNDLQGIVRGPIGKPSKYRGSNKFVKVKV